jgi:hypothetical protein
MRRERRAGLRKLDHLQPFQGVSMRLSLQLVATYRFCYRDRFFAFFEKGCDFLDDLLELVWWKGG